MTRVRTSLLIVLVIASTVVAAIATSRLQAAGDRAESSEQNLAVCRERLADLRKANTKTSDANPSRALDAGGVNQLLRDAAASADASGKLTGIEPGQPVRVEGTDYAETPIFLRLDAMPMKQLVTFLHESSSRDPRARCRSIELSAALGADAWTADVTVGYLSYSPRGNENR